MTDKWDIQGRSIDLTGKKRLVVVDFDNTRTLFSFSKLIKYFKRPCRMAVYGRNRLTAALCLILFFPMEDGSALHDLR